jgi:hypothetical protein
MVSGENVVAGLSIFKRMLIYCNLANHVDSGLMRNIILIELNEVPNLVLEAYAKRSAFMAQVLRESDRYTTICADQIQLDPWIAWPTFHRGVPDKVHKLLRLGQDTAPIDAAYPSIWKMLKDQNVSVGVWGSLFSSSESDQSGYRFMVPDVFSPHGRVKPQALSKFQDFNLQMTRASARNADEDVSSGGGRAVADLALKGWLSLGTMVRVAAQLVSEKIDRKRLSRRRNTQTELHGDVFCSLVKSEKPQFSTFYTNNVAAAMHRFWSASFQEQSINKARLEGEWLDTYSDEVFVALQSVERIIKRLLAESGQDTTIVIASAIGQEEIPAENHKRFITITKPEAFIAALLDDEATENYSLKPTMVPDFTIVFDAAADADRMCARLRKLSIGEHAALETLERMHAKELVGAETPLAHIRHHYDTSSHFKFPITFARSDQNTVHVSLQIDDYDGPQEATLGNRTLSFGETGIGEIQHEEGVNCTAQHCAEGSLVVHRPGVAASSEMQVVSSLDFVPSLLAHFNVAAPTYLMGKATIAF